MNKCFIGDCRDTMRRLIDDGVRVQTCVTSPPYWGLRDYNVDGQLGLEDSPEKFVENMVEVFDLVNKLLADDGTLWLNLGDSYYNYRPGGHERKQTIAKTDQDTPIAPSKRSLKIGGLKEKDLVGIPWRVAFALQAAGWYLRSDIIWAKPNIMPESVKDRPTKSHEYIFLLTKNQNYFYDADAIREQRTSDEDANGFRGGAYCNDGAFENDGEGGKRTTIGNKKIEYEEKKVGSFHKHTDDYTQGMMQKKVEGYQPMTHPGGRNKRTVWEVATTQYSEGHFATFPPKLIEPCILAGSRTNDIVFDPFFGSGTTGEVAQRLGRQWIGCELNPEYEKLQMKRTAQGGLLL